MQDRSNVVLLDKAVQQLREAGYLVEASSTTIEVRDKANGFPTKLYAKVWKDGVWVSSRGVKALLNKTDRR